MVLYLQMAGSSFQILEVAQCFPLTRQFKYMILEKHAFLTHCKANIPCQNFNLTLRKDKYKEVSFRCHIQASTCYIYSMRFFVGNCDLLSSNRALKTRMLFIGKKLLKIEGQTYIKAFFLFWLISQFTVCAQVKHFQYSKFGFKYMFKWQLNMYETSCIS